MKTLALGDALYFSCQALGVILCKIILFNLVFALKLPAAYGRVHDGESVRLDFLNPVPQLSRLE